MQCTMRDHGVGITPDELGKSEALGFEISFDGLRWEPTGNKFSKFSACAKHLWLSDESFTGQGIEKTIGHRVHILCIRHELLACMASL